jgi:hypothetical protein
MEKSCCWIDRILPNSGRLSDNYRKKQDNGEAERRQFWVAILIKTDTITQRRLSVQSYLLPYNLSCLEGMLLQNTTLLQLLPHTENDHVTVVVDQSHDLLWDTYTRVQQSLFIKGHSLVVHPFGVVRQGFQSMLERTIGQIKGHISRLGHINPEQQQVAPEQDSRSINAQVCHTLTRLIPHILVG